MRQLAIFAVCLFSLLCLSLSASAQVSRLAFEAVRGQPVQVELEGEETIYGQVRVLADESVVILTHEGEVRELRYPSIVRLRVGEPPIKDPSPTLWPTDAEQEGNAEVDATPHAFDSRSMDEAEAADQARGASPVDPQAPSAGYLSTATNDGYLGGGPHGPTAELPESDASRKLYLEQADYDRYRSAIRSSRVKRIVGWTLVSVGAVVMVSSIIEKSEANRWGDSYDMAPGAVTSALMIGGGTPLVISGRRQHRGAVAFAQEAAAAREVRTGHQRQLSQYSARATSRESEAHPATLGVQRSTSDTATGPGASFIVGQDDAPVTSASTRAADAVDASEVADVQKTDDASLEEDAEATGNDAASAPSEIPVPANEDSVP